MMIEAEIEWRADCWGHQHQALYLGGLFVGSILHNTHPAHHTDEWRGWFNNDEEGHETGWFATAEQARGSVETHLLNAIKAAR